MSCLVDPSRGRRGLIAGALIAALGVGFLGGSPALAAEGPFVIGVGSEGSIEGADRTVATLSEAQAAVREVRTSGDVEVRLAGGTYELTEPLQFGTEDAGANGGSVTWSSAPGETAVFSGGSQLGGWKLHDAEKNIWVADVAAGTQSRQLYIDGSLAPRTRLMLAADRHSRTMLEFTEAGITVNDPAFQTLHELENQDQLELNSMGSFTDRTSPVASIEGNKINMVSEAWRNNNFGYDTMKNPYVRGALYLQNAYEFLENPDEWFLDSDDGQVFVKREAGASMEGVDVRLPRIETLVEVGGTYEAPVTGLTFRGIEFAHTTWLRPSGKWGYADQQSGAHIVGEYERADDYLESCQDGCHPFEKTRNEWYQIPGAVQVAAAADVVFERNVFRELGSVGLGIGMDPNANNRGVGYGTSDVQIRRNEFREIGGSGIVVGGIQPDAHHPSDPRMTVQDITIADNLITRIGKSHRDSAGVLSTYVTRANILHNELTDLPYDGIDIGWGWGVNDPGSNEYYLNAGLHDFQPVYDTETTFRDNRVAGNLVYDTKNEMHDGGSIYTLSASPGTVIERNYIYDSNETFGMLIDQGSRYLEVRENVILGSSRYMYVNADVDGPGIFNTLDNAFTSNWWNGGRERYPRFPEYRLTWTDNVDLNGIEEEAWPEEAKVVMNDAGIRAELSRDSLEQGWTESKGTVERVERVIANDAAAAEEGDFTIALTDAAAAGEAAAQIRAAYAAGLAAFEQTEVDAQTKNLKDARAALARQIVKVDREALRAVVAEAELALGQTRSAAAKPADALSAELDRARGVLGALNQSQKTIDGATAALRAALDLDPDIDTGSGNGADGEVTPTKPPAGGKGSGSSKADGLAESGDTGAPVLLIGAVALLLLGSGVLVARRVSLARSQS